MNKENLIVADFNEVIQTTYYKGRYQSTSNVLAWNYRGTRGLCHGELLSLVQQSVLTT